MLSEEDERIRKVQSRRFVLPFKGGHVMPEQLEEALNYLVQLQDESDTIVKRMLRKEMKEMFSAYSKSTRRTISKQIYEPLSMTVGFSFGLAAGIFVIIGIPALSLLFLLGGVFGFLTYRRLKRENAYWSRLSKTSI